MKGVNLCGMWTVVGCLLTASVWGDAAMPTGGICAHRGDRATCPENTVPAFLSAVKKGAAMVEFDVHRCKTGELIVMHDDTIDRTTTGKGKWWELTFEYLRSVDAGVKKGPQFKGVKIPTFDEAIDCFPTNGVWLNVHCGDDVTDEVARKIKAKGRLHQAFIAAGPAGVKRARAAVPEVKVCLFALPQNSWRHVWTAEERRASVAAGLAAKAEFMQPHNADFTADELYAYHAAGGKMNYFWCNKPNRLASLLVRGIDFPLTDNLAPMVAEYNRLLGRDWAPPDPEYAFSYTGDTRVRNLHSRLETPNWYTARSRRFFGGIPSIAVSSKNGRLWRTFYAGPTDGEDSNNYAVLETSADDGKSWKEVLVRDPDGEGPWRAFDPEVWIAPDGRLHWSWTEREVPLRDGKLNRYSPNLLSSTERLMSVALDAEHEPAKPFPVPRAIASGVMMCKPLAASDGRWLYPVAKWQDDFSARLYASTDGGVTLQPLGGATLPKDIREFEEHNVVELKDGTLRVYMRTRDKGRSAWQADSSDGGRTWKKAQPCAFRHTNSRFFVRRLKGGALLLVKHGPLDRDIGRKDMTAYVSDDDGATWQGGLVIHPGACSYPDGDQAPDGTIYVIMDNDRYGKQELFVAKFTEDDVRAAAKGAK